MIKPIKFDLKLNNGETLRTLDDLKNNLSPELFEHFQSGKLAKWLRVRKLEEQANAVEKLLAEIHDREVQSFKGLIELFGGETDVDSLRIAIAERKKALPSSRWNLDDEVEQLKAENEALKNEIITLGDKIEEYKSEISTFQLKVERQKSQLSVLEKKLLEKKLESAKKDEPTLGRIFRRQIGK